MNIRKAQIQDVSQVQELVLSLANFYLDSGQHQLPAWFEQTLTENAFLRRIEHQDYLNYLYIQDGKTVGYIALKDGDHLFHLFVNEKYQGRGIARALWHYALRQSTADTYRLRSSLYAVPIYKKLGFIITEPCAERDGIKYQPMVFYRRDTA